MLRPCFFKKYSSHHSEKVHLRDEILKFTKSCKTTVSHSICDIVEFFYNINLFYKINYVLTSIVCLEIFSINGEKNQKFNFDFEITQNQFRIEK